MVPEAASITRLLFRQLLKQANTYHRDRRVQKACIPRTLVTRINAQARANGASL